MTARTDDYNEIVRVVQLYIDGFNDNEISKLREAFDEDAWMYYIDAAGVLRKSLISESFETWATPPGFGVVGRFVSVTQVEAMPLRSSSALIQTNSEGGSISTIYSGSMASGKSQTRRPRTAAGKVYRGELC